VNGLKGSFITIIYLDLGVTYLFLGKFSVGNGNKEINEKIYPCQTKLPKSSMTWPTYSNSCITKNKRSSLNLVSKKIERHDPLALLTIVSFINPKYAYLL
jgi:hypothetical protein